MEANHPKPILNHLSSTSPEKDFPIDEVYQMPRHTIAATKGKKAHKKKLDQKLSTDAEINEKVRLAAKGLGTSQRILLEGDSMVQDILQRETQKKKGLFFLCC